MISTTKTIWSNKNLDIEDWRENLAQEFRGCSDGELNEFMCEMTDEV